jgi:hypothetical protein
LRHLFGRNNFETFSLYRKQIWDLSTVIYTYLPSFGFSDKLSNTMQKSLHSCLAAAAIDNLMHSSIIETSPYQVLLIFFSFYFSCYLYTHISNYADILVIHTWEKGYFSWGRIYRNLLRQRWSYHVLIRWDNQTLQGL